MLKSELLTRSPIRILEESIAGGLGKGNLGVFTARKGVGKTASLVHVAVDKLLRDRKVLHISFADDPRHIESWYDQVFGEVARAYNLESALDDHEQIVRNRMILHFRDKNTPQAEIRKNAERLIHGIPFVPELVIVDGVNFYEASEDSLRFWKGLAAEHSVEMWFSATLHQEALALDDRGIPAPINRFFDFFSVIIWLVPMPDCINLKLLKNHGMSDLSKLKLKLDSKTLLIANRRI